MTQPPAVAAQPSTSVGAVEAHIESICREAGLGVMVQVLGVIRDRDEVTDEVLLALTADRVHDYYFGFLVRAIDKIESDILDPVG